jgi:hypothetical protein
MEVLAFSQKHTQFFPRSIACSHGLAGQQIDIPRVRNAEARGGQRPDLGYA